MNASPLWIKRRKIAALVVGAFLVILVGVFMRTRTIPHACQSTLTIGGATFDVIVAATPWEHEQGLSGKPGLAANEGMLFLFADDSVKSFWMKDMRFPIDMIWISPEWTVNEWVDAALPESYPRVFTSPPNTTFVLEVTAGTAKRIALLKGASSSFVPCPK